MSKIYVGRLGSVYIPANAGGEHYTLYNSKDYAEATKDTSPENKYVAEIPKDVFHAVLQLMYEEYKDEH